MCVASASVSCSQHVIHGGVGCQLYLKLPPLLKVWSSYVSPHVTHHPLQHFVRPAPATTPRGRNAARAADRRLPTRCDAYIPPKLNCDAASPPRHSRSTNAQTAPIPIMLVWRRVSAAALHLTRRRHFRLVSLAVKRRAWITLTALTMDYPLIKCSSETSPAAVGGLSTTKAQGQGGEACRRA